MAWEIAESFVDKYLGLHRFIFVDRTITTAAGEHAKYQFDLVLGRGTSGTNCPHCHQKLQVTHALNKDGALVNEAGDELDPKKLALAKIAELNEFHARMDAHARRHKASVGPPKR